MAEMHRKGHGALLPWRVACVGFVATTYYCRRQERGTAASQRSAEEARDRRHGWWLHVGYFTFVAGAAGTGYELRLWSRPFFAGFFIAHGSGFGLGFADFDHAKRG